MTVLREICASDSKLSQLKQHFSLGLSLSLVCEANVSDLLSVHTTVWKLPRPNCLARQNGF